MSERVAGSLEYCLTESSQFVTIIAMGGCLLERSISKFVAIIYVGTEPSAALRHDKIGSSGDFTWVQRIPKYRIIASTGRHN